MQAICYIALDVSLYGKNLVIFANDKIKHMAICSHGDPLWRTLTTTYYIVTWICTEIEPRGIVKVQESIKC